MVNHQRSIGNIFVLAVWLVIFLAMLVSGIAPMAGDLADPDGYMRLVRLEALLESGSWYDHGISRSNAPYGDVLHWSRPLDLLILGGVPIVGLIVGSGQALYWSAYISSPLVLLVASLVLAWAVRPIMPDFRRWLAPAIMLIFPVTTLYSGFGRADHHALILLSLALLIGATWRALALPAAAPARTGLQLGLTLGFALWVSLELAWAVALSLTALGLFWMRYGGPVRRIVQISLAAMLMTLVVAVAVEHAPGAWDEVVYDKVSIVHMTVVASALAALTASFAVQAMSKAPDGIKSRAAALVFTGIATAAIGLVLFPGLPAGPMAEIDPRIRPIWLDHVHEMRPLWPADPMSPRQWLDLGRYLLPALLALPCLGLRIGRESGARRAAWAYLAAMVSVASILAVLHLRFSFYLGLLAAPALADAAVRIVRHARRYTIPGRAFLRAGAVLFLVIGPGLLFVLMSAGQPIRQASPDPSVASTAEIAVFIAGHSWDPGGARQTILIDPDRASELLWRAPVQVIGTPYHRNGPGLIDARKMLAQADGPAVRALYKRRGVDLVVLTGTPEEARMFADRAPPSSLYWRLQRNDPPEWLRPVALPPNLDGVKIYRSIR